MDAQNRDFVQDAWPDRVLVLCVRTHRRLVIKALQDRACAREQAEVAVAFAVSPSAFARHLAAETEKWRKVVRAANIRPE